jgi:signal transduction histidine kinase
LSLVYGIISDHGGTVEAITNPDQGITVVVEIPLRPAEAASLES